jgi:hypothetical protein
VHGASRTEEAGPGGSRVRWCARAP